MQPTVRGAYFGFFVSCMRGCLPVLRGAFLLLAFLAVAVFVWTVFGIVSLIFSEGLRASIFTRHVIPAIVTMIVCVAVFLLGSWGNWRLLVCERSIKRRG